MGEAVSGDRTAQTGSDQQRADTTSITGGRRRPSGAASWGVPLLLGVAVVANAAVVPLVPFALATRLGWPLWWVGGYSFAVTAVTVVVNRRLSGLVDALARRSRLCLGCGVAQVVGALAAGGAFGGPTWLLVIAALGTAVGGAVVPVYYALGRFVARAGGRDGPSVNAVLRVTTSAGWVVGPAAAFAVAGTFGVAVALVAAAAVAAVGVVAVLVASAWLDERSARGAPPPPGPDGLPGAPGTAPEATGRVSSASVHRWAFAVVALFSFAHIATATSLPLLLVRGMGVPEPATGLLLGIKAAAEVAAVLVAPVLLRRWGVKALLTGVGAGAVLAYASYLGGAGVAWAVVGAVLEGSWYGVFAVTALTWVQSLPGARLGRSTGASMNGIYAGVLVGAPVSGVVASWDLRGTALLSLVSAGLAVVAVHRALGRTASRALLPAASTPSCAPQSSGPPVDGR